MHEENPQQTHATPCHALNSLINGFKQTTNISDPQPELQNPHREALGPVYKVCVKGTVNTINEVVAIRSLYPCLPSPEKYSPLF